MGVQPVNKGMKIVQHFVRHTTQIKHFTSTITGTLTGNCFQQQPQLWESAGVVAINGWRRGIKCINSLSGFES